MLLVAHGARRATQDIDLLGQRIYPDDRAVVDLVTEVARIQVRGRGRSSGDRCGEGLVRTRNDGQPFDPMSPGSRPCEPTRDHEAARSDPRASASARSSAGMRTAIRRAFKTVKQPAVRGAPRLLGRSTISAATMA